jgi:hypothetical protein
MALPANLLQIPRLNLANVEQARESILYKGDSGTGKTHNLLTWPQPMLVVYTDQNLKTPARVIATGAAIELLFPKDWSEFADRIVPAVKHRELSVATIGLDTVDGIAALCLRGVAGADGKMDQQRWGTYLNRLRLAFNDLLSATKTHNEGPLKDKPAYNLVGTSHLKDVTDETGNLIKIRCKIDGQFRDEVEAFFDTVLLCQAETYGATEVDPATKASRVIQRARYFCHTVPPTLYHTCKGHGLPTRVDGTYPSLQALWGPSPTKEA